jgi:hypothetical protein
VTVLAHVYWVTALAKRPHCLAGILSSSQKARPEANRRHLETSNLLGTGSKVLPARLPARPAELSVVCCLRLVSGESVCE